MDLRADVVLWERVPAMARACRSGDPRARPATRAPRVDLAAAGLRLDDGCRALIPVVVSCDWALVVEGSIT